MSESAPASRSARPTWTRFVPPALAAALVAGLGWLLLRPAQPSAGEAGGSLIGQAAPTFELRDMDGRAVQSGQFRGRPLVVNFWASWCGPCREEAPLFARLAARADAPAMVGVLFNETDQQGARQFIRQYRLNYPNLTDPGVETAIRYGVLGIPHTVFVDAQGIVRQVERGGLDQAKFNDGLRSIGVAPLE